MIPTPETINNEYCLLALVCAGLLASVTVMLTVAEPPACGIPEIRPVDELTESPAGRPLADHV